MRVILRVIGLRRIALLLWWLQYGASTLSLVRLPAELRWMPRLVNVVLLLLAPTVALWLAVFASGAGFAWSTVNALLLAVAVALDVALLVYHWRRLRYRRDTSLAIEQQVRRDYTPEQHDDVMTLLGRYDSRWSKRDTLYTRLHLLELAHGDADALRRLTEVAVRGPRDLQGWQPSQLWASYL
jgi:hypothetical protein